MRQTSLSQVNGGSPFWTRIAFVCSKARRSMSFGSTGAEGGVEILVTGVIDVIRRATGCGFASCPKADWQKMPRIRAERVTRRDIRAHRHPQRTNRKIMDQQLCASSNSCIKVNRLSRATENSDFGFAIGEPVEGPEPGGFCRVTIDKYENCDSAREVGIPLVTRYERGYKPNRGDYCTEYGKLNRRFFQGFQQPADARQTDDVLKSHRLKLCPPPNHGPNAQCQNRQPDGHVDYRVVVWCEIRPGQKSHDGKEDCSHYQAEHGGGGGLMPSCQLRLRFWRGGIQLVQSSSRTFVERL